MVLLGFSREMVKSRIEKFGSHNLKEARDFFMTNLNLIQSNASHEDELKKKLDESKLDERLEMAEKTQRAQDLLHGLVQEMPDDDENYLDFDLEQDDFYINKYNSLLDF
jgi:hypothetical protein